MTPSPLLTWNDPMVMVSFSFRSERTIFFRCDRESAVISTASGESFPGIPTPFGSTGSSNEDAADTPPRE